MVPNVESTEGWELYIVTDGAMVGILQLTSFSAFHDIGHHLSMFTPDSLMMAF
jgi:hypothetical protein